MKRTVQSRARKAAVIGVGYVGLPLALAVSRVVPTIGFDLNRRRIAELRRGHDRNGDVPHLKVSRQRLRFSSDPKDLRGRDLFFVAVPTPVDRAKQPDLGPLLSASRLVGAAIKAGVRGRPRPIVCFESTVYPGCTEERCVPEIAAASGLQAGVGFKVAYSPERVNPGDQEHSFERVVKVVGAEDEETLEIVAGVYERCVRAGVHRAPNIRTAEAAKVIENTQRDVNIALMNELAVLFHRLGLDTGEVLAASRTKWNFLPFAPGLVGGHCIPEDPYYLTYKAAEVGHHPQVILAGRRINDDMGRFVGREIGKLLLRAGKTARPEVLVLGVAFKENVRDTRNSRVVDLVRELEDLGARVTVYDPLVDARTIKGLGLAAQSPSPGPGSRRRKGAPKFDAVVLAVPHAAFREWGTHHLLSLLRDDKAGTVLADVRGALAPGPIRAAGAKYWRL